MSNDWTGTPPKEEGYWWYWDGYADSKAISYEVYKIGSSFKVRLTSGDEKDTNAFDGWWIKGSTPETPKTSKTYKSENDVLVLENKKLQGFKDWVHKWLDDNGVPHDPNPGETEITGCRIGGRMECFKNLVKPITPERLEKAAKAATDHIFNPGLQWVLAAALKEEFKDVLL